MFHRFRLLAAGLVLISLLGVVSEGASAATPARIAARLTSNSFTAARAGLVNIQYKFSSKSSRFAYVLSRKAGSTWSKVRSVSKRGSFRGSHTISVKSLFGSKPIAVGQYRLKLSSSANTVMVTFTITSVVAGPRAGHWVGTVSGPVHGGAPGGSVTATGVNFGVSSNAKTVWELGFHYDWVGTPAPCPPMGWTCPSGPCTGTNWSWESTPAPITNGQFSNPSQMTWSQPPNGGGSVSSGTFQGTFDSPNAAHGTAQMTANGSQTYFGWPCSSGDGTTGTFSWSATWQPSSS